jgi:predicted O-methyltransferase YrrM
MTNGETTLATQTQSSDRFANRAPAALRDKIRGLRERSAMRRSDPRLWRALDLALKVDGFTSPAELSLLYHLALLSRGGAVVEIGSYLGRSTIVLARAAVDAETSPIAAIDPHTAALGVEGEQPWDTRDRFLANIEIAGVQAHVDLLHMTSLEAAATWTGGPVAMLFVDGWHSHEAVLADVRGWARHLADPSCVVFDDFLPFAGVRSAVRELTAEGTVGGEALVVGKMVALGPPDLMRSVPAPPGARLWRS